MKPLSIDDRPRISHRCDNVNRTIGPAGVIVLTDWELWECARQQIAQYGDDAATHAAMRCDAPLTNRDQAGHHAWLVILDRIGQLSGITEGEVQH